MSIARRLVLLVSAVAVVTACSSSGTPAPTSAIGGPGATSALTGPGGGGNVAGGIPCDKLAPTVTQVTGLAIASTEAKTDDCTYTVDQPGDSSSEGLGGIVDIRQESLAPADFDSAIKTLTGTDGIDVSGVGDRARMTKDGSLLYAVHNNHVWTVQQELLLSNPDLVGQGKQLMAALFQYV